jgi:septum formation protein
MKQEILRHYNLLLGSKSPRRQELLKALGLHYSLVDIDVDEVYPAHLQGAEIARFLCELKADAFNTELLPEDSILVTADTIVWLDGKYIGKPSGKEEAVEMLKQLSGKQHSVYSGICLKSSIRKVIFHAHTRVTFRELGTDEIEYYVNHHKPFDKAGSYGIQDWIGYIGISGIEGCYYNVMGFPIELFYEQLTKFITDSMNEELKKAGNHPINSGLD